MKGPTPLDTGREAKSWSLSEFFKKSAAARDSFPRESCFCAVGGVYLGLGIHTFAMFRRHPCKEYWPHLAADSFEWKAQTCK